MQGKNNNPQTTDGLDIPAFLRRDPLWTRIFNSIPVDLPSGEEPKRLTFSQRAFITDQVRKVVNP